MQDIGQVGAGDAAREDLGALLARSPRAARDRVVVDAEDIDGDGVLLEPAQLALADAVALQKGKQHVAGADAAGEEVEGQEDVFLFEGHAPLQAAVGAVMILHRLYLDDHRLRVGGAQRLLRQRHAAADRRAAP